MILLLLLTPFIGAASSYVTGRILLPEMGLTAPEYWTWFWAWAFAMLISMPLYIFKELVK